jgi:hypothetical protein
MIKTEIIQRLLDNKHITAEEAVVLLSSTNIDSKTLSSTYYPINPFTPTSFNPYINILEKFTNKPKNK